MASMLQAPLAVAQHPRSGRGLDLPALMFTHRAMVPARADDVIIFLAPSFRAELRRRLSALLGHDISVNVNEEQQAEHRGSVRLLVRCCIELGRVIMTGVLIAYGFSSTRLDGQTEFSICPSLVVINAIWPAGTWTACYLLVRSYMDYERFGSGYRICPLDFVAFHHLARMLKTPVATIFFGVTIGILIRYTHACVVSTPYNGALAIINLVLTIIGLIDKFIFGPVVRGDTYAHTSRPLTQDEIDSIPLVHYIPPGTASIGPTLPSPQNVGSPSLSQNPKTRTHRFSFFRSCTTTSKSQISIPNPRLLICNSTTAAEEQEQGLPYVVLQDNLAACSICCSDFEAPPAPVVAPAVATSEDRGEAHELSVAVRPGYRVGELEVRIPVEPSLANVGAADGAERTPLRLLGCGHAFHKECIDQWLGQKAVCPNCMTPVRTTSAMFKGEVGSRRATV